MRRTILLGLLLTACGPADPRIDPPGDAGPPEGPRSIIVFCDALGVCRSAGATAEPEPDGGVWVVLLPEPGLAIQIDDLTFRLADGGSN